MLKPLNPCSSCVGWKWSKHEYVPASGSGDNGVLVIAEAAGEHETKEGMPLVGKAGYYLWQHLLRAGISREGFRLHNVLSCRPPNNKLSKMPYELEVIQTCSPLLDATIEDMRGRCAKSGRTFVIITLGRIAFKRIMGVDDKHPIMRADYLSYPFWHDAYGAWVYAADHPSYLMRGNNHLLPVLQFAFRRGLEVAEKGLTLVTPNYLLDPSPSTFSQWVQDYEKVIASNLDHTFLSYDIETPMKQGKDEEKVSREWDDDYTILRCAFAYKENEAVSVPWQGEYRADLEHLFKLPGIKVGWNSDNYDLPRIKAQMEVNGDHLDGMLMWHVLNSALPKGLGFVTPFYAQDVAMWKHLANAQPAFYNAKDADMALRNVNGIERDLRSTDLWPVFNRHVVQLNRVLAFMSGKGLKRDEEERDKAEVKLQTLLDGVEHAMADTIPESVKKFQVYKKAPKVTEGLVQVLGKSDLPTCPRCQATRVKADHFKSIGKKRLTTCLTCKKSRKQHCDLDEPGVDHPDGCKLMHHEFRGELENPCHGVKAEKRTYEIPLWAKPLDFKVSVKSLSAYQKSLRHGAIINRRENRVTYDEDAIKSLIKRYPSDRLYPNILKHREYQKLLSTYIGVTDKVTGSIRGGIQIGKDGRIHPQFTHNPSTLRMACQNPNMQNLPRAIKAREGEEMPLQTLVRNLVIASPGHELVEFDYSAIEAVLVGYFAGLPDYIRLAKLGIHSFLASHVLKRPADLKWSNSDLKRYFKEIKGSQDPDVQRVYNGCKRAIHLSGYGGTPRKMNQAEPETFPTVKYAEELQAVYFDLFPSVKRWQLSCQLQAEKDGFLRNPFGYVHRFYKVFSYAKECGKWVRKPGDDANRVLAFLPQSTAAGIIKEAMLRLYFDRFTEAGQYMRLQVHDSLVSDVPHDQVEAVSRVIQQEMERPVPELKLPSSYELGECLVIDTECKKGFRWGSMK